jgi:hypothetical protein
MAELKSDKIFAFSIRYLSPKYELLDKIDVFRTTKILTQAQID